MTTTLPKILAMGQKMPEMEERFILRWVNDERYRHYCGRMYDVKTAYKLKERGCVLVDALVPATPVPPPEWKLLQPGGASC